LYKLLAAPYHNHAMNIAGWRRNKSAQNYLHCFMMLV